MMIIIAIMIIVGITAPTMTTVVPELLSPLPPGGAETVIVLKMLEIVEAYELLEAVEILEIVEVL